ncbi:MAG TPA: DUF2383 domain-containing protein, partial [Opitutales bacterium]|nr:DUF2383 domain-containing protein [Opitutales bacterium]
KIPEGSESANVLRELQSGRKLLADQLNERLTALGESEKERASAEGTAHRALIDIKSWLSRQNEPDAILQECLRGEKKLIQYIDDTFKDVVDMNQSLADVINDLRDHAQSSITALEAS